MSTLRHLLVMLLVALTFAAVAADVDEKPMGETVERHLSLDEPFMQWVQDPNRVDAELSDTIELREGLEDGLETIKLTGLVPAGGRAEIRAWLDGAGKVPTAASVEFDLADVALPAIETVAAQPDVPVERVAPTVAYRRLAGRAE
mgnify:CR=1 FL=1